MSLTAANKRIPISKRSDAKMLPTTASTQNSADSKVPTVDLTARAAMYVGEIEMDGQKFTVDFDTGSATLVLPAKNLGGKHEATTQTKCSPQDKTLTIYYGSGKTEGCAGVGEFGIVDMKVPDYKYLAYETFQGPPDTGLAGLGGQALDSATHQKPFVQLLHEQGAIDEPMFSFSLASLGSSGESELFIGELDTSAFQDDEMVWIPTTSAEEGNDSRWMITADLKFGNLAAAKDTHVVVDSGTTLIALEPELYQAFAASWTDKMGASDIICVSPDQQIVCGQIVDSCSDREMRDQTCTVFQDREGVKLYVKQGYGSLNESVMDDVVFSLDVVTVDGQKVSLGLTVADCLRDEPEAGPQNLGVMLAPTGLGYSLFGDQFMDKVYTAFSYNRGNADKTRPAIGFGKKAPEKRSTEILLV